MDNFACPFIISQKKKFAAEMMSCHARQWSTLCTEKDKDVKAQNFISSGQVAACKATTATSGGRSASRGSGLYSRRHWERMLLALPVQFFLTSLPACGPKPI